MVAWPFFNRTYSTRYARPNNKRDRSTFLFLPDQIMSYPCPLVPHGTKELREIGKPLIKPTNDCQTSKPHFTPEPCTVGLQRLNCLCSPPDHVPEIPDPRHPDTSNPIDTSFSCKSPRTSWALRQQATDDDSWLLRGGVASINVH